MDELHFDIHAKGKSSRYENLINNYYNWRAILASGLKTNFFSQNPKEICNILNLVLQEKRAESSLNIFDEEIVVTTDVLLENKCITPT